MTLRKSKDGQCAQQELLLNVHVFLIGSRMFFMAHLTTSNKHDTQPVGLLDALTTKQRQSRPSIFVRKAIDASLTGYHCPTGEIRPFVKNSPNCSELFKKKKAKGKE